MCSPSRIRELARVLVLSSIPQTQASDTMQNSSFGMGKGPPQLIVPSVTIPNSEFIDRSDHGSL
jgi:hypothetical protein